MANTNDQKPQNDAPAGAVQGCNLYIGNPNGDHLHYVQRADGSIAEAHLKVNGQHVECEQRSEDGRVRPHPGAIHNRRR